MTGGSVDEFWGRCYGISIDVSQGDKLINIIKGTLTPMFVVVVDEWNVSQTS